MSVTVTATSSPISVSASATNVAATVGASTVQTSATGGVGPQGLTSIGDALDVAIIQATDGDVLRFSSSTSKWQNYAERNLTDGGNW